MQELIEISLCPVCRLFKEESSRGDNSSAGVAGIFTVVDQSSTDLTSSICETFTVPMMQSTADISPSKYVIS